MTQATPRPATFEAWLEKVPSEQRARVQSIGFDPDGRARAFFTRNPIAGKTGYLDTQEFVELGDTGGPIADWPNHLLLRPEPAYVLWIAALSLALYVTIIPKE